jgi:hypothetical protein
MRRVLISVVVAIAASLALSATASADTITTDFEGFNLGTVDGQDGWHSAVPGDVPALPNGYDQEVKSSGGVPGFGGLSLRHSNALSEATGEFEYQTYSKPNATNAGEALDNTEFDSTFQFVSTSPDEQPGLKMRISPDDSHGGRMSFVSFTDTSAGLVAHVADTPEPDGDFRVLEVPGTYSRTEVHTVRIWMKLVPGPDNDIVRIFIDGEDIGNKLGVCLETWENYYRQIEKEEPPVTNSLGFRSDNGTQGNPSYEVPGLKGGGYLFDNVATTTANGAGPAPGTCGAEGQIAPTGTTCDQYAAGTAPVLGEVQYTTRSGKINAVSPGVFFYYTKVSGEEGDPVGITQTDDNSTAAAIPIQQRQVVLYDASEANLCKVVKWTSLTVNDPVGTAEGRLPSSGDFIIGVKYNPSALKGTAAPNPTTATYSFGTELDGAVTDAATIDLVKK